MSSLLVLHFRSYKQRVFLPFLFFSLQHIFIHSRKMVNRGFFFAAAAAAEEDKLGFFKEIQ